jgi:thiopeptide-type bacteriocin biosynthesis protein
VCIAPQETADGVLAVLAGIPLDQAAARIRMEPADLADAVEAYRAAGYAAIAAQARTRAWYQVRVQFGDRDAAERTAATRLGPDLRRAEESGVVAAWWFIRKAPCWRLRLRPGPAVAGMAGMKAEVDRVLDGLAAAGLVERWREGVYEPETAAFGGPEGMRAAHGLFHADSRGVLDYLGRPAAPPEGTLGRRELSMLLCCALLRGAGQDWYEQGDVWHRVARMRPLPTGTPAHRLREMTDGLRRLTTADARPTGSLFGADGPLAFAGLWASAFDQAGRVLAAAGREGTLERGVRDVLAHHVIFHWNRLGLAARTQGILARAARDTVMNPPDDRPGGVPGARPEEGR